MHEFAIARSILDIVSSRAQGQDSFDSIDSINIRVGEFRNVDVESLEFAFDGLKSQYAGFDGTRLLVETIPSRASCLKRGHLYHPTFDNGFRCDIDQCGSGIGSLKQGQELDVVGYRLTNTDTAGGEKRYA